ncbi:MAG: 1,4-beta-xylanase, partial [Planctomycetaceae bacterium]|nr:1,4-beta-xylanase [Planctomycetaceae bacterium]
MKWTSLCPEEGRFRFEHPDRMIEYAQRHGLKTVGHTLVFNRKHNYPEWLFRDGDKQADATLVWKRIETHLETVMGRYRGKIDSWDVLNEFIELKDPGYRHTDYTEVLGPDYPIRLFKLAAACDPDAKLTYNDFGVEQKGRRDKILAFVRKLQDEGCRVDVVGSQSHLEIGNGMGDEIADTIQAFSKTGVKCAFTELDVDVMPRRAYWNL